MLITLHKAADYLEEHGWCQRIEHLGERACVWGALKQVADVETVRLAREAIVSYTGIPLTIWNDEPGQTVENVVKTLRSIV